MDMADSENIQPSENKKGDRGKNRRVLKVLRNVIISGLIAAVIVVLVFNLIFPVLRINGNMMGPVLFDGDIVITYKTTSLKRGDICIFQLNDSLLCKRVIGIGGDKIDMDEEGTVYVNDEALEETYLNSKSFGNTTVTFPVTVPEGCYFVLGDNRRTSIDSRHTSIGFVNTEQVVGKVLLRVLPTPDVPE